MKIDFLCIQKRKRTAVSYYSTHSWRNEITKKRQNGGNKKKINVTKEKKAKNFGRVPQQIICSKSAIMD